VGTSLISIAKQSFAPNIEAAERRLKRSGSPNAKPVISAADAALGRVLRDPKLLLDVHAHELAQAFSRTRHLAERSNFEHPHCLY
jgi:hypothetical protein